MKQILVFLVLVIGLSKTVAQENELRLFIYLYTNDSIENQPESFLKFNNFNKLNTHVDSLKQNYTTKGYIYLNDSIYNIKPNEYRLDVKLNQQINHLKIKLPKELEPFLGNFKNRVKGEFLEIAFDEFKALQTQIGKQLNNKGKSFDRFQLTQIKEIDNQTIEAKLQFDQKNTRYIDKIYVKGYENFPPAFIKYRLGLRKGQTLNIESIAEKTKNIDHLIFVDNIKPPEAQFTVDSTKLFLYVQKNNANVFDGFIGFNSTEETSLELNGYIDLNLINNLNLGEELRINYKNDGRAQQQFNTNVRLPYLFKTPITAEAGLNIFRKDSAFSNTSQGIDLNYQIQPLVTIGSSAEFTRSTILENSSSLNSDSGENFNSAFYGINASFFKSTPITGKFNNLKQIRVNVLTGRRSSTISSSTQFKTSITSQYTFQIQPALYLYTSTNAAWLSSSDYIDNELFRFGGMNSIRGFEENALVASLYGTLASELRYFLSPNLYANSVLDFGYYQNSLQNFSENLYSFGFGLGIETRAGVLRLIFANGTSNSQNFSFENTQVHLSLFTFL